MCFEFKIHGADRPPKGPNKKKEEEKKEAEQARAKNQVHFESALSGTSSLP